jgi:hypothetical protein
LVQPFDTASLAQAVLGLLLDPDHAATLGQAARRDVVAHAALDVQARNYEALFERMVANSAPKADAPAPPQPVETDRPRRVVVPNVLSSRLKRPEVVAAYERFTTGVDRYITPEAAAAAKLAVLDVETRQLSAQLDHQAHVLLSSRSWRLSRLFGLGSGLTADKIVEMPSVSEKLWAVWSVLHSRRWEAMAPLRLVNRLLRGRPGPAVHPARTKSRGDSI